MEFNDHLRMPLKSELFPSPNPENIDGFFKIMYNYYGKQEYISLF